MIIQLLIWMIFLDNLFVLNIILNLRLIILCIWTILWIMNLCLIILCI